MKNEKGFIFQLRKCYLLRVARLLPVDFEEDDRVPDELEELEAEYEPEDLEVDTDVLE